MARTVSQSGTKSVLVGCLPADDTTGVTKAVVCNILSVG